MLFKLTIDIKIVPLAFNMIVFFQQLTDNKGWDLPIGNFLQSSYQFRVTLDTQVGFKQKHVLEKHPHTKCTYNLTQEIRSILL